MVLLHEAEKEIGLKSAIEGKNDTFLPSRLLILAQQLVSASR